MSQTRRTRLAAALAGVTTLTGAGALATLAVAPHARPHHPWAETVAATAVPGLPARGAAAATSAGRHRAVADVPGAGPFPRTSDPITDIVV